MKTRIRTSCALVAVLASVGAARASAQACTSASGAPVVNGILDALVPVLNQAWPSFAVNNKLDPWMDPCDGTVRVPLKCSYGGDEICGVQLGSSCVKEYADIKVKALYGLSYLRFKDADVTSLVAASGDKPCPSNPKAAGGNYACSYTGAGSASAYLVENGQLSADLSSIKVKVQCSFLGAKYTETLYSGSATCNVGQPKGNGDFNLCAGSCAAGSVPANLEYAALSKLELDMGKPKCDVKPDYNPLNWVAESLVPKFEKELTDAITPPIEEALNDFIADYLPFPKACGQ